MGRPVIGLSVLTDLDMQQQSENRGGAKELPRAVILRVFPKNVKLMGPHGQKSRGGNGKANTANISDAEREERAYFHGIGSTGHIFVERDIGAKSCFRSVFMTLSRAKSCHKAKERISELAISFAWGQYRMYCDQIEYKLMNCFICPCVTDENQD